MMKTKKVQIFLQNAQRKLIPTVALIVLSTGYACNSDRKDHNQTADVGNVIKLEEAPEIVPDKKAESVKKTGDQLVKKDVPEVVVAAFEDEYPVAEYVKWYGYPAFHDDWEWYTLNPAFEVVEDIPEYYLIDFEKESRPEKVIYSGKGEKIATRKMIKETQLPKAVLEALRKSEYKDWKITGDREEISREKDKSVIYRIDVEKGAEKEHLLFNKEGRLIHHRTAVEKTQ